MRIHILSGLVVSAALWACGKPSPAPIAQGSPPQASTAPEGQGAPTQTAVDSQVVAPEVQAAPEADAQAAPEADAQVAVPERAESPEEAVRLYYEGTREKNGDKLWVVMSTSARTAVEGVKASAVKAPEADLQAVGLERAAIEAMDVREFFAAMVRATPTPAELVGANPPADLEVTGEGERRGARFKLGPSHCEAELLEEDGGWRVDSARCEEGG